MDVRVVLTGIGFGSSRLGFGVNALSYCYIQIRANRGDANPRNYAIDEFMSLGGESSTIIFGSASTDWMEVDSNNAQLLAHASLKGKIFDVAVSGTAIGKSTCDVTIKIIDEKHDAVTLLEKYGVSADALQLAETKVRGKLKHLPGAQLQTTGS